MSLSSSSSSFPTNESVQRHLLSFQHAVDDSISASLSRHNRNDSSFRQPRVLYIDPHFYTTIENNNHDAGDAEESSSSSKHEIQITKRTRAAKKHLENSRQYRKWQRDPLREGDCKPMKPWQETSFPSCNKMHEMEIQSQFQVLTNGGYNTVYKFSDMDGSTRIAKILKYARDYTDRNLDRVRRDSLIMERATASDFVLDTYSYCGFSQLIEYGEGGDLNYWIMAVYERLSQKQKLQIATQISQALADVHNLDGNNISSMTHGDLASKQFILVDGKFKLSDFNRGRFLRWDEKTNEPCPYTIGSNDGKFRSPEEYDYIPQTSAIDVWALGSVLVQLVTGEEAWDGYENEVAQSAIVAGKLPPFREKIKYPSDPINQVLVKAIGMCYVYEPKDRPKAGAVVEYLKNEVTRLGFEWNRID
ncbi:unnamed protein product [Cylindrotheca closterium]|uniref:Protein kinase domain-containing protein n=1 Tax=Cylindrotheca closterium TaxID=2856 RepID=A0AAD2GBG5_9STRA|nr:unnamed protein product [Cylindrotheca closterium]